MAEDFWADKCGQWWHSEKIEHIRCHQPKGHGDLHQGYGLLWEHQSRAPEATARKFIACYRQIPNSHHRIFLHNSGTVEMTLDAFRAATCFIGVRSGDD